LIVGTHRRVTFDIGGQAAIRLPSIKLESLAKAFGKPSGSLPPEHRVSQPGIGGIGADVDDPPVLGKRTQLRRRKQGEVAYESRDLS
jgi:hypothetical protein